MIDEESPRVLIAYSQKYRKNNSVFVTPDTKRAAEKKNDADCAYNNKKNAVMTTTTTTTTTTKTTPATTNIATPWVISVIKAPATGVSSGPGRAGPAAGSTNTPP